MDWTIEFDKAIEQYLPDLEVLQDEPMSRHTTFRIGGPAKRMAFPSSREQLVLLMSFAKDYGANPLVIGNGSNLLVPDEGLDRLVIDTSANLNRVKRGSGNTVLADAGATLARTADLACKSGLTGLEFAHGIPGTLGGGVFMNAGAYDGELAQVIAWVDCLDLEGQPHRLAGPELELGYRHSVFSHLPWLITGVGLDLAPGDPQAIRAKMADLAQRRRAKQPLEYPSAGSTFKRPAGHFAGGLIEQCGLKGTAVGGAQVSEKHAGFVINTGGATCRDILTLIRLVRDTVRRETGVELEPEVRLLGCTLEEP